MKVLMYIIAGIRALIVFTSMAGYMFTFAISRLWTKPSARGAFFLRKFWLKTIGIPILNIRIQKEGEAWDKPAIYMGNHRSFADPMVVCRYIDAFVIAKAEVANYPIINKGAEMTGVIWVNRNDKNFRTQTRGKLVETWSSGHNILVFPEGTVGLESKTLPFKVGTFLEAAANNIPIIPFAIEFKSKKDLWVIHKFIPQYFYQFSKWATFVKFSIGEPIYDTDGENLKLRTQKWIDDKLVEMQKNWSEIF
ncbi:MAG: lysophospholipid acyltransferase family protein [Saprospiraceae bacterium]